jgi:hypothetical protein
MRIAKNVACESVAFSVIRIRPDPVIIVLFPHLIRKNEQWSF